MANETGNVIVVFDASYGGYNTGERAGFAPWKAHQLIEAKVAHKARSGGMFAKPKKTGPPEIKLEVGARVRVFVKGEGDALGLVKSVTSKGLVTVSIGDREIKFESDKVVVIAAPEKFVPDPTETALGEGGGDASQDHDGADTAPPA